MQVEYRLFGEVEVLADGRALDLGHARQRSVLAALLADPDTTLPTDRLVARVWGAHPPARPESGLYSYLSRLRRALRPVAGPAVVRRPGGYRVQVDPRSVDIHQFRELAARAAATAEHRAALRLYDQALLLWRDDALTHLDTPWADDLRATLRHERVTVELERNDRALRCGEHARLLPELAAQAAARPLDERLAGQHMIALHRAGRSAEALLHYRRTREVLAGELGVEPGRPLRHLQARILAGDPTV